MIDARIEMMSSAAVEPRRRSASVSATRSPARNVSRPRKTLRVERIFSDPRVKPFDQIEWEKRTAEISDDGGEIIFKKENREVPKILSLLPTQVVGFKYFYGEQKTPVRGASVP